MALLASILSAVEGRDIYSVDKVKVVANNHKTMELIKKQITCPSRRKFNLTTGK